MTNYRAIVESNENGYYVEFPDLNWAFYSIETRSRLEADIRRELEIVTGDKDFYIAVEYVGEE